MFSFISISKNISVSAMMLSPRAYAAVVPCQVWPGVFDLLSGIYGDIRVSPIKHVDYSGKRL